MKVANLMKVAREKLSVFEEAAVARALAVREHAYAPYSEYKVGAAVVSRAGNVYVGVNTENHIYVTPHAEMNACAAMNAGGEHEFNVIAIAAANGGIPCGLCLQVIREWARDDLAKTIVLGASLSEPNLVVRCTLEEALQVTDSFGPRDLEPYVVELAKLRSKMR